MRQLYSRGGKKVFTNRIDICRGRIAPRDVPSTDRGRALGDIGPAAAGRWSHHERELATESGHCSGLQAYRRAAILRVRIIILFISESPLLRAWLWRAVVLQALAAVPARLARLFHCNHGGVTPGRILWPHPTGHRGGTPLQTIPFGMLTPGNFVVRSALNALEEDCSWP
jgi:hypothetical protein